MTKAPRLVTCTCCGAELTAPQFHNGYPYGWTCIKKVDPTRKQSKVKYVQIEMVKNQGQNYYGGVDAIIDMGGIKKAVRASKNSLIEQNGVWYAREDIFKM